MNIIKIIDEWAERRELKAGVRRQERDDKEYNRGRDAARSAIKGGMKPSTALCFADDRFCTPDLFDKGWRDYCDECGDVV